MRPSAFVGDDDGSAWLAELRAAVTLLTRLPVVAGAAADRTGAASDRTGAVAFPLVGAAIGATASIPVALLGATEPTLAALLAVAVVVVLTGALHLDGLADTADALLAPDPGGAERARKDPAVGPGGVAALVLVVAGQVTAIDSVIRGSGPWVAAGAVVVAAALARIVPVVVVRLPAVGRAGAGPGVGRADGFGAWFAERVTTPRAMVAVVLATVVLATVGLTLGEPRLVLGAVGGLLVGTSLAAWLTIARDGPDGDVLGAGVELAALAVLAGIAVLVPA